MKAVFSEKSGKDLAGMDQKLRNFFIKHAEKLVTMPPRRHIRYGLPYNVEDVTKQARMVYEIRGNTIYIIRCFKDHKEYERWYESYK